MTEEHQIKLEYESAHFLQSLFGHAEKELRYLEGKAKVRLVTRDGWLEVRGSKEGCDLVEEIFADLEEARRNGGEVTSRDFRTAVDLVRQGGEGISALGRLQLVGARGCKPVVARSPNQLAYLNAMVANEVVFGLGPAGTGKTYLAVAMALDLLRKKEISRLVLTRPAVEAGEALGYLPGDLQEKILPYLLPLYDAMEDMLGKAMVQKLIEHGEIEIAPLAYMRGRTLSRSFIVLDEAQNTTTEQMMMFLTRLGEGSRMVVTGDITQVDLPRSRRSGLKEAMKILKQIPEIQMFFFSNHDVVRHPVVQSIIEAYEKNKTIDLKS